MRVFLALDPSDALRDALDLLIARLHCGRPVDADDLHLTLAFVAAAAPAALHELDLSLGMMRPGPATLEIRGLDTFGGAAPRLVHAAAVAHPDLVHLHRKIANAARRAGLALPRSRFVPHITLARFGRRMTPEDHARLGRFLEAHGDFRADPEAVREVSLYRSMPTEDGPRYDLLERYPLI